MVRQRTLLSPFTLHSTFAYDATLFSHPHSAHFHTHLPSLPQPLLPSLFCAVQSTRNTVPVPRHWCFKRKYLQGKRGIEKPPFNLPFFIKDTGVMEMRQALQEKEDEKTLKAKTRERVRGTRGMCVHRGRWW